MTAWIARNRTAVLVVSALVMVASIVLALRLRLVTDLTALLPSDNPAVVATQRVRDRLGTSVPLQIAIESPDRAANLRFANTLTESLSRAIDGDVAYNVAAERRYFQRNGWLYLDLADLTLVRDRVQRELVWPKNPLLVDLEEQGTGDHDPSLEQLTARIDARARRIDRFPEGMFMSPDGSLVVVVVWPSAASRRNGGGEALLARVQRIVSATHPEQFHREMRIGYAGGLYDAVRERRALQSDLVWSAIVCLVLVSLVVALFFGRLRAVPLVAIPALLGVGFALGVASLLFGELNATTAFLGSIILGNGINTPIIQLARYEEERRRGVGLSTALQRSVTSTIRATGTAAFAAAIAYGSLVVTQFRGFSEFGVIGAIGIVAAWGATILVLPALVATLDRRQVVPHARDGLAFGAPFARVAVRAPHVVTFAALAFTAAAVGAFVPYASDPFEYDLRRLGSARTEKDHDLATRTGAIFGTFTPTVVLADRFAQVAEVASRLRARRDAAPGVIDDVITLDDLIPGSAGVQHAKLAVIAEIRRMFDEAPLDPDEEARFARWRPPTDLAPIELGDIPPMLLRPFRDVSGNLAPVVLVYRASTISYWNGRDLMRFAGAVHEIALGDGARVHAGGASVVFAGMIDAIDRDGPTATLISLVGVALLALFMLRRVRGVVAVVGSLVVGVSWMVGGAAIAGVRVNFLNFIALPLTFGIGIDYAVNVYLRHRLDGPGRVAETVRATGGAVALCSLTTTIGYASLLLADSHGLRSFGALAILGELACVLAALLVMPAALVLVERSRRRPATASSRAVGQQRPGHNAWRVGFSANRR